MHLPPAPPPVGLVTTATTTNVRTIAVPVAEKWRKKPVVIEAMCFDGTRPCIEAICRWANDTRPADEDPWITYVFTGPDDVEDVLVDTLEGHMRVDVGDYVIRGVKGEFYPCKPDIFEATYDPA